MTKKAKEEQPKKTKKQKRKFKENTKPGVQCSDYITYCRQDVQSWTPDDMKYFAARTLWRTVTNNVLMKRIMPANKAAERNFAKYGIKPNSRTPEQKENDRKLSKAADKILNGGDPKMVYRELRLTKEQQEEMDKDLPTLLERKEKEEMALIIRQRGCLNNKSTAELLEKFKQN